MKKIFVLIALSACLNGFAYAQNCGCIVVTEVNEDGNESVNVYVQDKDTGGKGEQIGSTGIVRAGSGTYVGNGGWEITEDGDYIDYGTPRWGRPFSDLGIDKQDIVKNIKMAYAQDTRCICMSRPPGIYINGEWHSIDDLRPPLPPDLISSNSGYGIGADFIFGTFEFPDTGDIRVIDLDVEIDEDYIVRIINCSDYPATEPVDIHYDPDDDEDDDDSPPSRPVPVLPGDNCEQDPGTANPCGAIP